MTFFPTLSRRHALGALLAASALLSAPLPAAAQDKPEVIRIGSTAPGHLKFILFRDKGLLAEEFAEDGIRVELSTFDGGSAVTVALGSGAIDLTYIGNNPSLRLAASGADVKAVGLSSWVPGNETLVLVRADSDIRTLADLKGRKVAYLAGTVRHSTLAKALEAKGVAISDVESMNLGIDSSGPALERGDIDALVESGGTAQKLVDQGLARVIFDAAVSGKPEWSVPHVISVNGEFARNYPDIVTRILAVDIATARWVDDNPDETISSFVAGTGNAEASVRATYADGKFFQNPEFTDTAIAALQAEEAFMAEAGLLRGKVDYDSWIDRSFHDAALSRLDQPIN
ncbi:aliphatic sulfonate ABC transporter substrate-binding protein [Paracoccus siganidrum]|uniref:Aliphatic sulfonate ABC transporter substrate-binding protein n=1 Tax=Paracoccus siganidrum TaxID=1276757 RepID=A0A419A537_9RHOB|nr:aliphatic sulfonate ABC transporter substrate-binding protein [Paracoccus siganidrum]RJL10549.1 aliphatic sulfonate ABC transporter substrate-binding protein [Paracoccus siganidrum]RMC35189.1 aliphatic sulfonates ABC transporter substrate-binding protein [Paracoccus siganidrum]